MSHDEELLVPAAPGFEVWRLVLVGRLILNSAAIVLNLLNCLLLRKLCRKRRAHTSLLSLLYLSYAELGFTVTSQLFSVLFLASHTGGRDDHSRSSPPEHQKFFVLVALASFGSLKHSSLFVRQWWLVCLVCLHGVAKRFRALAHRLAARRFVRGLYSLCLLVGASFGLVRLVAEKIPEYFRKDYISEEQHELIHRVLYVLEFGVPPLLAVPCVAALAALVACAWRRSPACETGDQQAEGDADLSVSAALQQQQQQQQQRLTWSWRSSQVVLIIGLLFVVLQGPLILLDRVGAESPLFINLQDLVISLFSCSYFVIFCATSAAFRNKLAVMCTCTVTAGTAERDTTVLDSACEMVPSNRI